MSVAKCGMGKVISSSAQRMTGASWPSPDITVLPHLFPLQSTPTLSASWRMSIRQASFGFHLRLTLRWFSKPINKKATRKATFEVHMVWPWHQRDLWCHRGGLDVLPLAGRPGPLHPMHRQPCARVLWVPGYTWHIQHPRVTQTWMDREKADIWPAKQKILAEGG